jgi:regulator of RNase E activity RraB
MRRTDVELIHLADMDAWDAFWAANAECLEDEVGDEVVCFELACDGLLVVGGGAAPLFRIGFAGGCDVQD